MKIVRRQSVSPLITSTLTGKPGREWEEKRRGSTQMNRLWTSQTLQDTFPVSKRDRKNTAISRTNSSTPKGCSTNVNTLNANSPSLKLVHSPWIYIIVLNLWISQLSEWIRIKGGLKRISGTTSCRNWNPTILAHIHQADGSSCMKWELFPGVQTFIDDRFQLLYSPWMDRGRVRSQKNQQTIRGRLGLAEPNVPSTGANTILTSPVQVRHWFWQGA